MRALLQRLEDERVTAVRDPVTDVTLQLPERYAYALAELCKRIGWADARSLSVSEEECRLMLSACDQLRAALHQSGVSVR
jgi:hypothetical protein